MIDSRPRPVVHFLVFICLLVCLHSFGFCKDLYETNFDAFPTGLGAWVGTEGWVTTGASTDAFGISDTALPDLGNTAYIGFQQPAGTFNVIFRPFEFDPVGSGQPIVRIETILGVQDSTNGRRDQFFIGIRNQAGALLAGVGFDNRSAPGEPTPIVRLDGVGQFGTAGAFTRNELHILYLEINFAENTWSAELDGLFPIFTDLPFSNSGNDRDFGFLSCEWQLSSSVPTQYGNNFLLLGDFLVQASPVGADPIRLGITVFTLNPPQYILSWLGEPGFQYQLEYTPRSGGAFQVLPDTLRTSLSTPRMLQHVDTPPSAVPHRIYRVQRSVQP